MLPFDSGGIRLKLQARVPFTSSTIGLAFGTVMCDNGEVYM